MAFATIMVHVDLDASTDARVRLAVELAGKFTAGLIGAAAWGIRPVVSEGIVIAAQLTDRELDEMRARLDEREAQFRQLSRLLAVPVEWRSGLEPPTTFLAQEARAADLIVIGRDRVSGDLYDSLDPADLILSAGRPVLAVPPEATSLRAKRIMIAWKETREARRALQDALPFLHEADAVFVAQVCEDGDADGARDQVGDVVHYLSRHRIKATTETISPTDRAASDVLIHFARDNAIDLIVAGGYGHSRLGEWIFGGVTRGLLRASPACCLFSH